jgi:integrase
MHQLTGDFYTVGMILGHSFKGMGIQLGISTNLEAMTARYVDVRLERKKDVLDAYHNALHPKHQTEDKATQKQPKKRSRGMEL